MMYKASEQDIKNTIDDFIVFCNFIEEEKPVLSKKRGVLGKKDSFKLNSLLHHKREVNASNFQQESYPILNFIFNLALIGELYVREADDRGKLHLVRTVRKDEFDKLNIYEKYVFLLETFWTKYDLEQIFEMYFSINYIDKAVEIIAKSIPGEHLEKGSFSGSILTDPLFSSLSIIIKYFNYFGFCKYVPVESNKKITKYEDSIRTVIPTEFGVNICKVLKGLRIADCNEHLLKRLRMDEEEDIEDISLYEFLESVFPEGALKNTVTSVIDKNVKGNYVFKVSLDRGIWRKIKISSDHTLWDLHNAIQEAFDFGNDHLYSFFMDGKRYSRNAYHAPMGDEGPFVNEVTIGELGLFKGQRILYLFDYGDSWEFDVQLVNILQDETLVKKFEIIEVKGEAPPQYGYYYDDEEDFE